MTNQPIRVFWDFEFTGLRQDTTPISLACVTDANDMVFYAEFSDYNENQVNEWIAAHVLSKLRFSGAPAGRQPSAFHGTTNFKGDRKRVALALYGWLYDLHLLGSSEFIEMWGDVCAYDWVLFCELMTLAGDFPPFVYYIPFDLATLMKVKGIDPDINRMDFIGLSPDEAHSALQDAAAIHLCYAKLMGTEL